MRSTTTKPTIDQATRQRFGLHLFHLRESAGFTQVQVAERAGLSRDSIMDWEAGRYLPSVVSAKRLADALEISLDELARGIV